MIIVTGVSRSGTSVTMDICRHAGLELVGEAFPQPKKVKTPEGKCLDYMRNRQKKTKKDMNPNGFWEDIYAVGGIYYRFEDADRLRDLELKHTTVCKIVARGLIKSDPKYIDKIILLSREPREVATSQERMVRNLPVHQGENVVNNPEAYIKWASGMCVWLAKYSHIPVLVVRYEDLFKHKLKTLASIEDFCGVGDFSKAIDVIDPKLYRSSDKGVTSLVWGIADEIYNLINEKRFHDIFDVNVKNLRSWTCARNGVIVNHERCNKCRNNPEFLERLKQSARNVGIDYTREPCLYECGMGDVGKPISIKKSIKENFWNEH